MPDWRAAIAGALSWASLIVLAACGDATAPEPTDPRLFVAASAGGYHTCAITADPTLCCWGLGYGMGEDASVPVPVPTSVRFRSVTVGGSHACGVSKEGVMYCWGSNRYGQLGDGSNSLGWMVPVAVWKQ